MDVFIFVSFVCFFHNKELFLCLINLYFQGLTEKFKEKDSKYTGRATLSYDTFLSMILPFLASY